MHSTSMEKEQHHLISPLSLPFCITLCLLLVTFLLATRRRCTTRGGDGSGGLMTRLRRKFGPLLILGSHTASSSQRRGLSIQVTDRAVAHRALLQHSAAFLDRPTGAVPSTILTGNRHNNIHSAPYGAFWRALRRNIAGETLHPSRLRLLIATRRNILAALVENLKSGSGAGESLYFAVFSLLAAMCFGDDVVAAAGEARLLEMQKLQRDVLLALPSFGVFVKYPTMARLLYPQRWRRLRAFRRQQEDTFLPLIADVKNRKINRDNAATFRPYVDSLLDLRLQEEGNRSVTDGELVSLVSEFLGTGTESTATVLQWTMANLVKHPELQRKLRFEVDAMDCTIIEEAELSRMPYLKAVVLEGLRRHPPVPFVLRHVEGEEAAKALGGFDVPEGGATVNFLVGKIGRDAAEWTEPMAFSPERFMPGGEGEGVDLTCTRELKMMPFGAGRRICPGLALAMMHLEYFVANLVKEFEWSEFEGDEVDLAEFRGLFLTVMNRPLRALLVPRTATSAAARPVP